VSGRGADAGQALPGAGITLASGTLMFDSAIPLAYSEPTVMWRMRRVDGLMSHAVIGPHSDGPMVVWFLNDRPIGCRAFDDWTAALRWSDQMQLQNWAVGWRLISE